MTQRQRLIVLIGAMLMVGMTLMPPWIGSASVNDQHYEMRVGYRFIGEPPDRFHGDTPAVEFQFRIDLQVMVAQYLAVGLATAGLALFFRAERQPPRAILQPSVDPVCIAPPRTLVAGPITWNYTMKYFLVMHLLEDRPKWKAIGASILLVGIYLLFTEAQFAFDSKSTIGAIESEAIRHEIRGKRGTQVSYVFDYSFVADNGRTYAKKGSLNSPPSTSTIRVYYRRTDPSDSRLTKPHPELMLCAPLGIALLLWGFQPWNWRESLHSIQERAMAEDARIASGYGTQELP